MKVKIIKAGELEDLESSVNGWVKKKKIIKIDISVAMLTDYVSKYETNFTRIYIATIIYNK